MSEMTKTLIRLIQLNGKDFKVASDLFLKYYKEPPTDDDMEVNRNQAAMLGWCKLLNMQTQKLLDVYDYLPADPVFQKMVEGAYAYFFPVEKKPKVKVIGKV